MTRAKTLPRRKRTSAWRTAGLLCRSSWLLEPPDLCSDGVIEQPVALHDGHGLQLRVRPELGEHPPDVTTAGAQRDAKALPRPPAGEPPAHAPKEVPFPIAEGPRRPLRLALATHQLLQHGWGHRELAQPRRT